MKIINCPFCNSKIFNDGCGYYGSEHYVYVRDKYIYMRNEKDTLGIIYSDGTTEITVVGEKCHSFIFYKKLTPKEVVQKMQLLETFS